MYYFLSFRNQHLSKKVARARRRIPKVLLFTLKPTICTVYFFVTKLTFDHLMALQKANVHICCI